jgi:branched-chain amino acid transport system ATP-binding protein
MAHADQENRAETILKIDNIHMYFGRGAALAGVSLDVKKGEIHSIIGPNGAGKTVLMNCINGLYRPQKGRVYFKEKDITDVKPHGRASMGFSRPSENRALRWHDGTRQYLDWADISTLSPVL